MSKIKKLKPTLSCGPDGISQYVLKECSCSLIEPLSILFNLWTKCSIVPDIWKSSYVVPIFKKGNRESIVNYRPIISNSAISKILDSIMSDKLSNFIEKIIVDSQHGFESGKSTITNLMIMVDEIYNSFDKKYQVDVVYTDFSKTFDFVNFDILIKKLHMYNVPKEYINWYDNFLWNRIIKVKINDSLSESLVVPLGVRQGSHSGPNLFKIYINDLPDVIKY